MNVRARIAPASVRARRAIQAIISAPQVRPIESWVPFGLFMLYMLSFYLRFPARLPVIAPFRPDLIIALLVLISTAPYLQGKMEVLRHPAAKALSWLVVWVAVSLPFVEWPGSVVRENWQPFLKAALFFYFALLLVDTPKRLKWFVYMFLLCQVFRVMEPLYLNLTQGYLGSATYLGGGAFADRLSGAPADVINPNGLGFVIATTIVWVHFMWWRARSIVAKGFYLAIVPGMLYAMILTMSRGGFIALLVGGWLIFRQSRYKVFLVAMAILAGFAGWSVMTDYQKDRYLSLVSDDTAQSATREGRIQGMIDEFRLGLNNPVFGHGIGTTAEAKVNIHGGQPQASHNLYAELLIEVGAVGFIIFMIFLWRIHQLTLGNLDRISARKAHDESYEFFERLNRALLATFWVYAVYSINYFGLSQDYWYVFAGICVAFAMIMDSFREQGTSE